jgi:hypothetical protein
MWGNVMNVGECDECGESDECGVMNLRGGFECFGDSKSFSLLPDHLADPARANASNNSRA